MRFKIGDRVRRTRVFWREAQKLTNPDFIYLSEASGQVIKLDPLSVEWDNSPGLTYQWDKWEHWLEPEFNGIQYLKRRHKL